MSEYSTPTQFIDLVTQQKAIRKNLDAAIGRVLDHGQFIMGPEVTELEAKLAEFIGSGHALTCANGTDALTIVLMAWGIGAGDAVFVPSFTYVASAEAPAQLGASPFFVDVCKDSFNISPESLKQAIVDCRAEGLRPAAVIAVDLFGRPADIDLIGEIAEAEKLKLLIDGAQSFGASSNGRRVGSMGDATTTSFFPAKPLGCYGDGGAIFTSCADDLEVINSIRLHGRGRDKYDNVRVGLNSRLDTIQAAILLEKLAIFESELDLRQKAAGIYAELLGRQFKTPTLQEYTTSAWAQYTILVDDRDRIHKELKLAGIPAGIYYPTPLCMLEGYKKYPVVSSGTQTSLELSKSVLSLPMHPYLTYDTQKYVCENLKAAVAKKQRN